MTKKKKDRGSAPSPARDLRPLDPIDSGDSQGPQALERGPGSSAPSLTWSIHPARRRPYQAACVFIFIIVTIALVHFSFREFFYTVLGTLMLFLSLTTYFLPTRYEIDETEIRVRYPFSVKREPLTKFRAVVVDRNGLLLSTASNPTLAHELRSIFLVIPKDRREEVKTFLEERLEKRKGQAASVERGREEGARE